jgi:peptidoglycan/xylan/chitin deacetylase (PgdA/CDA1 family)
MRRALLLAALCVAAPSVAERPPGGTRFAAIAWHDVVDTRDERADDAVTTQSLIETFDWLKADGWTPVSVDRIAAAAAGGPPLPEKAVLLSFDDGYRSFYTRVYPLLLAYDYPAVLALVTSWMEVPAGGEVDYGGRPLKREAFVTWDEVRTMQASGLVEIASHSHDLHRTVLSTPQGNSAPSARTWAFDPATGRREDDAAHRARIRADLDRTRARIAAETGKAPRVLVWPFGRFSGPALAEAGKAGFGFAFTLEPEMADARQPMALHRYYPTRDPSLGVLAWNLGFPPPRAQTVRLACADLAPLAAADPATEEVLLGQMIEDVRLLGATGVVLDIGPVDGERLASAWVPTPLLPLSRDLFGRVARQLSVRGGVQTYARLPFDRAAAAVGEAALPALAADIARAAPIDGLLLEGDAAEAAPPPAQPPTVGDIRTARDDASGRAQRVFAGAAEADPRLRLLLAQPAAGPGPAVDRALLPPGAAGGPWLTPAHAPRVVLTLPDGDARAQRAAVRDAQLDGATALALCPWKPGTATLLGPAFSAATFPRRP